MLDATATLGLINGACNISLPVHFDMRNGGTDANNPVSYADADGNGVPDFVEDKNHNGVFDGIDRRPDFISRILPGLHEIRRAVGITPVAGLPILLQFLIFSPGTVIIPGLTGDPALGFPTMTFLANIGDPAAATAPIPITDFCTPLAVANVSFGTTPDGQHTILRNPAAAGTQTFTTVALGLPDADGDGIENPLDTCPLVSNVGDPRIPGDGDADQDGLDAACDPNDSARDTLFGDVDCNHGLTIGDAQKIARSLVGLAVTQEPGCATIGALVNGFPFGDVDCNHALTIGDAQKIARQLIHLSVSQEPGCMPVGFADSGTNSDQDLDGYLNRQDNCPLVPNGLDGPDNQRDTDRDFIGDACDPRPTTRDGANTPSVTTADVDITS